MLANFCFPFLRVLIPCTDHNSSVTIPPAWEIALVDKSLRMAGFETSSGVVMFTLLDLAHNMEAQTKLREELLAAELDWKTIENLPYLDAVTRERSVNRSKY